MQLPGCQSVSLPFLPSSEQGVSSLELFSFVELLWANHNWSRIKVYKKLTPPGNLPQSMRVSFWYCRRSAFFGGFKFPNALKVFSWHNLRDLILHGKRKTQLRFFLAFFPSEILFSSFCIVLKFDCLFLGWSRLIVLIYWFISILIWLFSMCIYPVDAMSAFCEHGPSFLGQVWTSVGDCVNTVT